jgi:hypothetical protein
MDGTILPNVHTAMPDYQRAQANKKTADAVFTASAVLQ